MKKVTFLAATAAVAALIASPVVAQDAAKPASNVHAKSDSAKSGKTVKHSRATKHMRKHHARASMRGDVRGNMRSGYVGERYDNTAWQDRYEHRGTGFWPADVVGGAVGAGAAIATTAVGTAGAIATAPFGGPYRDAYAYDHGYGYGPGYDVAYDYKGTVIPYSASYAARNGFVCQPGTMVTYPNGTRTICQ
jgi:hypothetical protein